MRVVMFSKALVVGAYQRKLEEMARLPGVQLWVVVPPYWRDRRGNVRLERAHTAGYELLESSIIFNGQYHLHFYPEAGSLLRRLRPDIVHADEEPYNLATYHLLRTARAAGAHGLFFTWQNLQKRYPWPFSAMEQQCYRLSAGAIAGNRDAEQILRDKGFRGPVALIPQFGVDPEIFSPCRGPEDATLAVPFDADAFVVGYGGGLLPEKGVDLLLRACAALGGERWRLLLLGEGPERVALERLAEELGIGHRVHFAGRVPSTATPAYYRRMNVLVLPSLTRPNWGEQFGRVLIEAMGCGVPVVGSSSMEIPRVVGDAGLIFPEGDVPALCAALRSLLDDESLRRELAARGRARVLENYTQAQIAVATVRFYERLLHENT